MDHENLFSTHKVQILHHNCTVIQIIIQKNQINKANVNFETDWMKEVKNSYKCSTQALITLMSTLQKWQADKIYIKP
jgi:hypothetical protein